jgi:poly-gamma-glutamate synthesis protein (capsule biosynthesis protein)
VNLETPLLPDCQVRYGGLTFCGEPRTVAGLQYAGIDVVNLANNHTENYGERGILATQAILSAANIAMTGFAEPIIFEVQGRKIGLLGFNDSTPVYWVNSAKPKVVEALIQAARPQVDVLIVAFHWGVEYETVPRLRQRNLAKLAINSGADAVIGHHPHWVQGVEIYRNKPILYSLGNFVFDQGSGGWFNEGILAVFRLQPDQPLQVHLLPVIIEDLSTPRFADQTEATTILRRILSVSAVLGE